MTYKTRYFYHKTNGNNAEVKVIKTVHGKTFHDMIESEDLEEKSNIQNLTILVRQRGKY